MIEIVKRGRDPQQPFYQMECPQCRSILRYQDHDARPAPAAGRGVAHIDCPVCDVAIPHSEKNHVPA